MADPIGPSLSVNISSSGFTSSAKSAPVDQTDVRRLEQGKRELSEFGSRLSKLRDLLSRLQKVSFRNTRVSAGSPASAHSPASLGLDFGAGDETAPVGSVAALAAISSGTFEINGVALSIDVGTDSLGDVVDRINGSAARVTASLHQGISALVLVAEDRKQPLELGDGGSGLFTGLGIGTGTHRTASTSVETFRSPNRVRGLMRQVAEELNHVLRGRFEHLDGELLAEARSDLQGAVLSVLGLGSEGANDDRVRSGLGLDFNFTTASPEAVSFRSRQFARAAEEDFQALTEFLFREPEGNDRGGFTVSLIAKLDEIAGSLVEDLAGSLTQGALADVTA